jgi:inhibitor of KinA sporulation pathway (predicted exonuclease)
MEVGHTQPQTRRHEIDYLVCVDFEATCDEGPTPTVTRENQEIIEFPWVVVDLRARIVVDRRQLYVKPEWSHELTRFCIDTTGITPDKLANAPYLVDAIAQFDVYVHEHFVSKGTFFFANWQRK